MARGPKKHLKRIATPSHWCLDKLGGVYAPRPSNGPHKLRECIPLVLLLRNRLRYALTYNEAKCIAMQRCIRVNGKIRTDTSFPLGVQDVISIARTDEQFRLLYNAKGRFLPHRINAQEAQYKLCRIQKIFIGPKGTPHAISHDGRTLRFLHPDVKVNDTVRLSLETNKVLDFLKFEVGCKVMITGGHNRGRIGTLVSREKNPGTPEVIHLVDERKAKFATRLENGFCIGSAEKFWISLPSEHGIRKGIIEDRNSRLAHQQRHG